jgi:hypothetical protein
MSSFKWRLVCIVGVVLVGICVQTFADNRGNIANTKALQALTQLIDASGNLKPDSDYRSGYVLSPKGGEANAFADKIVVSPGQIMVQGSLLILDTPTTIDFSDLDTGSEEAGTNYYVYVRNNGGSPDFKISKSWNLTTIGGLPARKIGYFHNSPPTENDYNGEILRYSIFSDERDEYVGMVDVGVAKVDIYKSTLYKKSTGEWFGDSGLQNYTSGTDIIAVSAYGKNPGVYTSWYEYKEAFANTFSNNVFNQTEQQKPKFMVTPYIWLIACSGTPDPDTSAPASDTSVAISNKLGTFLAGETLNFSGGATATYSSDDGATLNFSGLDTSGDTTFNASTNQYVGPVDPSETVTGATR